MAQRRITPWRIVLVTTVWILGLLLYPFVAGGRWDEQRAAGRVVELEEAHGPGSLTKVCVADESSGQTLCGEASGSGAIAAVRAIEIGDCAEIRVNRGAAMTITPHPCRVVPERRHGDSAAGSVGRVGVPMGVGEGASY